MFGWAGRILRVDLSRGKVVKEDLRLSFAKAFLGGRGFNSKIIYDELNPKVTDPYSPENIVCISPGGLVGATLSASRVVVSVARSPITGLFGDANMGSHWGSELKWAGYDTIVLYGRSKNLAYLKIEDDVVEIKNGEHLKGKTIWETDKMLKEEVGDEEARVIAIGPAGENLIASANTIGDLHRAAGGCGTGAVLGSKNMKAIVVRGTKGIKVAKPERLEKAWERIHRKLMSGPLYKNWSTYGSSMLTGIFKETGLLPTFNWQQLPLEGIENVDAPALLEKYHVKHVACIGCAVHCDHYYLVAEGPHAGTRGAGVEYEALNGYGPRAGGTRLDTILYINNLLNQLGLDVVQTANWINTIMHWWQDGLVDEKDTDGLVFEWGNYETIITAIRKIAYREGEFANAIADNIFSFAEKLSRKKNIPLEKLTRYIIHDKKMTHSSGEVRGEVAAALARSTSTRGGDHLRGANTEAWIQVDRAEDVVGVPLEVSRKWEELGILRNPRRYEGKSFFAIFFEHHCAVCDALGICKRHTCWEGQPIGLEEVAEYFSAATGIEYTWKDLERCGERIYNVERAIQVRYGVRRKDDYPAPRFMEEPVPSGPIKGAVIDKDKYDKLLTEYYKNRRWTEQGIPTYEKLMELGLEDVAKDLKGIE